MTEQAIETNETEEQAQTEDMASVVEQLRRENDAMRSKMDEMLGETKRAKEQRLEAEARARAEAEEKAKKAGDYEQLHRSSEEERMRLKQELDDLRGNIAKEKEQSAALRLASELADGANAELLSEFIARRLKFTEEGIRVLSSNGELTVSTLSDLKAEFQTNARFASLLKGTQASGGSAPGAKASGLGEKIMNRTEFDKLGPQDKFKFISDKGQLVD